MWPGSISKLQSRKMNALRVESLKRALAQLPVEDAIIDGEIVCLDDHGVSQFNWLDLNLNGGKYSSVPGKIASI